MGSRLLPVEPGHPLHLPHRRHVVSHTGGLDNGTYLLSELRSLSDREGRVLPERPHQQPARLIRANQWCKELLQTVQCCSLNVDCSRRIKGRALIPGSQPG